MNNKYYVFYSHLINKSFISELYSTSNIDNEPIDWHIERLQRYSDVATYPTMIVCDSAIMFSTYDSVFKSESYFIAYPQKQLLLLKSRTLKKQIHYI